MSPGYLSLLLALALLPPTAVGASRFGKKIDLELLEADLMEDEDPDDNAAFVMEKGDDGKLHPTGESRLPKPEMMFVELKEEYNTKKKVEEVAEKWTSLLWTNGLKVRPYPIDDNRLLFVVDTGLYDTDQFKKFALDQEETKVFEYKQQKYYPGDTENKNPGGVDMAKVEEILRKQGISLGGDTPKPRRKKKAKTRRQRKEEKRKRNEAKKAEEAMKASEVKGSNTDKEEL